MKRSLWFILAAFLAWGGFTASAGAQPEGLYLTPKLGVSIFTGENRFEPQGLAPFSERKNSTHFAGALAVGYSFADRGIPLRTEVEFTLRSSFETGNHFQLLMLGVGNVPFKNRQDANIHTLMFNT